MRNDYTNTKATKGRGGTMDGVGNGLGSNVIGRRHSIPGSDTPNRNKGKRFGVEELPRSALSRRNSVPIRTKDSVQGGARIQGGNIQAGGFSTAYPQTPQTVRLFTWQGISETLLLLWLFFLMMTTRATGCGHVVSAYDVDTTAIAEIPEVDALRQAIDSGRDELRTASERFNKAALSIPANEKIRLELPYYFRDSTGN